MKSLGIDTYSTNFSAYRHCRVMIEFAGGNYHENRRSGSAHKVIVPYTSFSKKLQSIHRVGGKITNISILHFHLDEANATDKEVLARISEDIEISAEQSVELLVVAADVSIAEDSQEISVENPIEESVVDPLEITIEAVSLDVAEVIVEVKSEQIADYIADTIACDSKTLDSDSITETFEDGDLEAIAEIIADEELESIVEILPETIAEEILPVLEVVEANIANTSSEESVLSTPTIESSTKSKKTKPSGKSGHGFNKQNDNTKSSRKPKS